VVAASPRALGCARRCGCTKGARSARGRDEMAHIAEACLVVTLGVGDASSSGSGDTIDTIYVDGGQVSVA
jgi:hypothetical protein